MASSRVLVEGVVMKMESVSPMPVFHIGHSIISGSRQMGGGRTAKAIVEGFLHSLAG